MTEQRDDPTYPPPASPEVRQTQSVGVAAHLVSVLVAVVLVPIAFVLLDYAMAHGGTRPLQFNDDSTLPAKVWVLVGVGSGLLVVAAGIGRLSGLGPLVAGLVWGAAPTLVTLLSPLWIHRRIIDLPEFYDFFGFALEASGLFVYPIAGALLIGSGLGGRWLRSR